MKNTARLLEWMVLLACIAALAVLTPAQAVLAAQAVFSAPAERHNPAAGGAEQQTTPVPANTPTNAPRAGSPILGILVLLAPAVWLVWKSYQDKQLKKRKAAC